MSISEDPRYLFSDRPLNIILDGITYVVDARMDKEKFQAVERVSGDEVRDPQVLSVLYQLSIGLDTMRRLEKGNGIQGDIQRASAAGRGSGLSRKWQNENRE